MVIQLPDTSRLLPTEVGWHPRDPETAAHVRRLGVYAAEMALRLGWQPQETASLRLAAPLHDIGKMALPSSILRKRGPLDDREWRIMRTHTTLGAAMLEAPDLPHIRMAARIARSHHERWDGHGYPDGLQGQAIPVEARIVCLLDSFDALISPRVYKRAWPLEDVLAYLEQEAGRSFDPDLACRFLEAPEVFVALYEAHREGLPEPVA